MQAVPVVVWRQIYEFPPIGPELRACISAARADVVTTSLRLAAQDSGRFLAADPRSEAEVLRAAEVDAHMASHEEGFEGGADVLPYVEDLVTGEGRGKVFALPRELLEGCWGEVVKVAA